MSTTQEPPARAALFPEQVTSVIIPATVNTIRTKRLILRPLALSDAEDIFEHRKRQDVAEWLGSKPPHKDVQETRDEIAAKIFKTPDASGALSRQFAFAIILADDPTQKVMGALGVNTLSPSPSIGYVTHPDIWGKGLTTEAVGALVDAWWKLSRKDPEPTEKLFAGCSKANVGSLKVLLKNGFKIYKELPLNGEIAALFELEKPSD